MAETGRVLPLSREPLLDSSRDLRIHVRAWDDGQVALARTLLSVAPFVDHAGLVDIIAGFTKTSPARGSSPDAEGGEQRG